MSELILGESVRTLDERYRLSLPAELADRLASDSHECVLAKELPGCLSVWKSAAVRQRHEQSVSLVNSKYQAGRLDARLAQLQLLGRLLSTRQINIKLTGRSRIVVPEGFREFLGIDPGGSVVVIGAAICVEIWHPQKWHEHVSHQIPEFQQLLDQLVG